MIKTILFLGFVFIQINCFADNKTIELSVNNLLQKARLYRGNNPKLAMEYTHKALHISKENKFDIGIIEAQNLEATIRFYYGEYDKALDLHLQSLELAEKIDDKNLIASTLNSIGTIYQAQKKNAMALDYFKKSLEIAEKNNEGNQILSNLYKLGQMYETMDSLSLAYKYYKRSLLIEENNKNNEGIFLSLLGIGSVSAKRNDYHNSWNVYNRALELAQKLEVLSYQMLAYKYMGELSLCEKKFIQAKIQFLSALKIAESLQFNKEKRECYINLAETNENLMFYTDAYYFLSKYVAINDTIFTNEANERFALMEVKFDLKNKEKEIELLKERQQQDILLRNSLLIGISLIILLVFLMIYLYRNKKRHNYVLKDRNLEIQQQKEEITTNLDQLSKINNELMQKNNQITESLEYALTVQRTMLPGLDLLKVHLGGVFKVFLPRDIVSGDFYWFHHNEDYDYVAVVDCTGHGIAGALMSMIANTLLNNIVEENPVIEPHDFLALLNKKITLAFKHKNSKSDSNYDEGLDITLFRISDNKTCLFSMANHNLSYVVNGQHYAFKGDMYSVGGVFSNLDFAFTLHKIIPEKNSMIYMYSDGFQDQIGGDNNKKFMFTKLEQVFTSIANLPLDEQKIALINELNNWKGANKQTDDILVMGLKLHF